MWHFQQLGRLMAQDRLREAAAERQAREARRARRREPGTSRFALLGLRNRHHES